MIEVARKTGRMVNRIAEPQRAYKMKAIQLLNEGVIGRVYMAKGLCFKRRPSIGHAENEPTPPGVNWDMFLGPAPMRPFNKLRFKYNWHWFWDTGNGDIGNQGVHEMDIARWGIGEVMFPKSVVSTGGRSVYNDDQETPNSSSPLDSAIRRSSSVRGIFTGGKALLGRHQLLGNLFLGATLDGHRRPGVQGVQGREKGLVIDERRTPLRTLLRIWPTFTRPAARAITRTSCRGCHRGDERRSLPSGQRQLSWPQTFRRYRQGPLYRRRGRGTNLLLTRKYRAPYVVERRFLPRPSALSGSDWLPALPSEQARLDATRVVFDTQRQAGIDLPTDGELYRFDINHPDTNGMIEYFIRPMAGIRSRVGRRDHECFARKSTMKFRRKAAGVIEAPLDEGSLNLLADCELAASVGGRLGLRYQSYMLARTLLDNHQTPADADGHRGRLAQQVADCPAIACRWTEANIPQPEDAPMAAAAINCVLDAFRQARRHLCFGNYGGQTIQKGSGARSPASSTSFMWTVGARNGTPSAQTWNR
jgi:hypothetical protein